MNFTGKQGGIWPAIFSDWQESFSKAEPGELIFPKQDFESEQCANLSFDDKTDVDVKPEFES